MPSWADSLAESQGKLNLNEPPGHYTFTYQTSLPHLIWNEYHNANTDPDPTKWTHRPPSCGSPVLTNSRPRA